MTTGKNNYYLRQELFTTPYSIHPPPMRRHPLFGGQIIKVEIIISLVLVPWSIPSIYSTTNIHIYIWFIFGLPGPGPPYFWEFCCHFVFMKREKHNSPLSVMSLSQLWFVNITFLSFSKSFLQYHLLSPNLYFVALGIQLIKRVLHSVFCWKKGLGLILSIFRNF